MRVKFDEDLEKNMEQMTWFMKQDKKRVKDLGDLLY
jgi:hypothetical protein